MFDLFTVIMSAHGIILQQLPGGYHSGVGLEGKIAFEAPVATGSSRPGWKDGYDTVDGRNAAPVDR